MPRKPKPPMRSKADKAKQQAVLDRMQQDLDGYVEKYDGILDKRLQQYGEEIQPYWERAGDRITQELKALLDQSVDAQRVPITQDPIKPAKLRNMEREIQRLTTLAQQLFTLAGQPDKLQNTLAYTYTDSYYFHAFGLEKVMKLAVNAPQLTPSAVMGILANPWLPDGNTYSDRIRANTFYLAEKMRQGITDAVNMGWDWNKTARHIQDTAGEGYFNSVRLARTEMNRAAGQAASNVFMQNADILDGKKWRATLDARTSPKCAVCDGLIFELDYDTPERPARAGQRIPNHPNCRCKYSPVISGVSPKVRERIARGEGDTKSNFGERTYTKAKDYREYAKERGLPDLDEALANENPKKYLRRGEDMSAYNAPSGLIAQKPPVVPGTAKKPAAAKPAPPADAFAASVRDRIAKGIGSEADLRDVGKIAAEELAKKLPKSITGREAAMRAARQESGRLARQLNKLYEDAGDVVTDEYKQIYPDYEKARKEYLFLLKRSQGDRAPVLKELLGRVRPVGLPPEGIKWEPGGHTGVQSAVEYTADYLPKAWLEKSNAAGKMLARKEKRGFYQEAGGWNKHTAQMVLSGQEDEELRRVAWHELGHRFEDIITGISAHEQEFYLRRTKGESLEWMGAGYKQNEVSRKDNFLELYMGKDYSQNEDGRSRFYELLSMGIEGLYSGNYPLDDDTNYRDFILGVLLAL